MPWRADYVEFDLNKDKKLTHLEVAVWQAKQRQAFDITQFDINNAKANIRRKDKNSNGQLDPDEIAQGWPPDPQEYDKDGDGTITLAEIQVFIAADRKRMGYDDAHLAEAKRLMLRHDQNRTNYIEAYEFPDNALVGKLNKEALEKADLDKDDRISLEELAKHLAKASS